MDKQLYTEAFNINQEIERVDALIKSLENAQMNMGLIWWKDLPEMSKLTQVHILATLQDIKEGLQRKFDNL